MLTKQVEEFLHAPRFGILAFDVIRKIMNQFAYFVSSIFLLIAVFRFIKSLLKIASFGNLEVARKIVYGMIFLLFLPFVIGIIVGFSGLEIDKEIQDLIKAGNYFCMGIGLLLISSGIFAHTKLIKIDNKTCERNAEPLRSQHPST